VRAIGEIHHDTANGPANSSQMPLAAKGCAFAPTIEGPFHGYRLVAKGFLDSANRNDAKEIGFAIEELM
jgi:hypothetical protein